MQTYVPSDQPELALIEEKLIGEGLLTAPLDAETRAFLEAGSREQCLSRPDQRRYELEVVHGYRLPDPGDERLERFIRDHHRVYHWTCLYLRHHIRLTRHPRVHAKRALMYFTPFFELRLHEVTRRAVLAWYQRIGKHSHGSANNALWMLKAFFNKMTDWDVFHGVNPCVRHKLFPRPSRTRFVQPTEMAWLLKSLAEEMPKVETYFLTLLLTGARRDEARLMKWCDLDLTRALWHKPTSKSGAPHTVPLPTPLLERIQQLPRSTPWVFPAEPNQMNGHCAGQWCPTAVEYHWRRVRKRAGLEDVTIHDLRRTAASWLACNGTNLSVIQKMLNHSSLSVTGVYARLQVAPVRQALEEQAARMLTPKPTAEPNAVPLAAATPPTPPADEAMEWPG